MRFAFKKWFTIGLLLLGLSLVWCIFWPDVVYPKWIPASARWIRSSHRGLWLSFDAQVKFEAPVQDCLRAADALIAAHKKETGSYLTNYFNYDQQTIDTSQ